MAPIKTHYRLCQICKKRYSRLNDSKRKLMAQFPKDEDRCRQWVKVIGNEDLAYVPIEKLHELKYVCADHFQPKDFNKQKSRLKKWAVPSLLLNRPPLPDHLLAEFPCHIVKSEELNEYILHSTKSKIEYEILNEHNYFKVDGNEDTREEPVVLAGVSGNEKAKKRELDPSSCTNDDGPPDQIAKSEKTVDPLSLLDEDVQIMEESMVWDTPDDDINDTNIGSPGPIRIDDDAQSVASRRNSDHSGGSDENDITKAPHQGICCNVCVEPIVGFRYVCVECPDYDLCAACEARSAHPAHYVLRVPGPRPYTEMKAVLEAIRSAIAKARDTSLHVDEIKSEPEDQILEVQKIPVYEDCGNMYDDDAQKPIETMKSKVEMEMLHHKIKDKSSILETQLNKASLSDDCDRASLEDDCDPASLSDDCDPFQAIAKTNAMRDNQAVILIVSDDTKDELCNQNITGTRPIKMYSRTRHKTIPQSPQTLAKNTVMSDPLAHDDVTSSRQDGGPRVTCQPEIEPTTTHAKADEPVSKTRELSAKADESVSKTSEPRVVVRKLTKEEINASLKRLKASGWLD